MRSGRKRHRLLLDFATEAELIMAARTIAGGQSGAIVAQADSLDLRRSVAKCYVITREPHQGVIAHVGPTVANVAGADEDLELREVTVHA